jgi:hypothetical protein
VCRSFEVVIARVAALRALGSRLKKRADAFLAEKAAAQVADPEEPIQRALIYTKHRVARAHAEAQTRATKSALAVMLDGRDQVELLSQRSIPNNFAQALLGVVCHSRNDSPGPHGGSGPLHVS